MSGKRLTRRSALGLIVAGAATSATGAFSFRRVQAPRSGLFSTTSDPNALLGLEGVSDTSVVPTFINNSTHDMSITLDSPDSIEFDVGNDGNWVTPPTTFSLAAGASKEVNVRFSDCSGSSTATVNIDSTLLDGGTNVGSIVFSRDFAVSQAGQIQFSGQASSAGSSGKYDFSIENTGCIDITIVGVGINETTTDADKVDGNGSFYNTDTGDELVTTSIPVDSSNPDSDTRRDLDPDVTIPQNQTTNFQFDKFQRSGPGKPNVDMRGEDVRVTLYFSDGSSGTIELCLGSCDF